MRGNALHKNARLRLTAPRAPPAPAPQEDSYRGRCDVAGALPSWLRGTLFRAGPGLWEVGDRQLRHMSDGEVGRWEGGRQRRVVWHA